MADNSNVYFMSAVGFKPPHKGHVQMIKEAVEKAASRGANYKLFIGKALRGDVTLDQSVKMLKIFLNGEDISVGDGSGEVSIVEISEPIPTGRKNKAGEEIRTASPLQGLINLARQIPEGSVIVVPTSSEDASRADVLRKILSYSRPDIEVEGLIVEPTAALEGEGKLSATDMRAAIAEGDLEKFKKFIPEGSLDKAEGIWTDILGRELPVNNLTKDQLNEMIKEQLKTTVKNILEENRLGQQYDMDQADIEDSAVEIAPGEEEPEMRLKDLHRKYYPEEGETPTEAGGLDAVAGLPPREQGDNSDQWYADYMHSYNAIKANLKEEDTVEEISSMGGGDVQGYAGPAKKEDELVEQIYNYLLDNKLLKTSEQKNEKI